MEIRVEGELGPGVTAKDLILHIIGRVGAAGGTGYVIEYRGTVFERMSVDRVDHRPFGHLRRRHIAPRFAARQGTPANTSRTSCFLWMLQPNEFSSCVG